MDNIVKSSPTYTIFNKKLGLSNNFYVKLFKKEDIKTLQYLAKKYSLQVLGHNEFMPLWVSLSCGRETPFNAMEASNIFFETGLFESAEPELLYYDLLLSIDTYFSDQWGIKNIGQYGGKPGVDIKAEQAWTISKGSKIRVAVFDHGFEMNHPDLVKMFMGQDLM